MAEKMATALNVYQCKEDLSANLAGLVADASQDSIAEKGCFNVALSGGSLPKV
jgi:6-phosphogluconolactonase/glucosamine-6-phosphate isomerase/deaminase